MLTTELYSFWQKKVFFNLSYETTNEFMFLASFIMKFLLIFMLQEQLGVPFSGKEKLGFFYLLYGDISGVSFYFV